MKRFVIISLVFIFVFSLVACSHKDDVVSETKESVVETESVSEFVSESVSESVTNTVEPDTTSQEDMLGFVTEPMDAQNVLPVLECRNVGDGSGQVLLSPFSVDMDTLGEKLSSLELLKDLSFCKGETENAYVVPDDKFDGVPTVVANRSLAGYAEDSEDMSEYKFMVQVQYMPSIVSGIYSVRVEFVHVDLTDAPAFQEQAELVLAEIVGADLAHVLVYTVGDEGGYSMAQLVSPDASSDIGNYELTRELLEWNNRYTVEYGVYINTLCEVSDTIGFGEYQTIVDECPIDIAKCFDGRLGDKIDFEFDKSILAPYFGLSEQHEATVLSEYRYEQHQLPTGSMAYDGELLWQSGVSGTSMDETASFGGSFEVVLDSDGNVSSYCYSLRGTPDAVMADNETALSECSDAVCERLAVVFGDGIDSQALTVDAFERTDDENGELDTASVIVPAVLTVNGEKNEGQLEVSISQIETGSWMAYWNFMYHSGEAE